MIKYILLKNTYTKFTSTFEDKFQNVFEEIHFWEYFSVFFQYFFAYSRITEKCKLTTGC